MEFLLIKHAEDCAVWYMHTFKEISLQGICSRNPIRQTAHMCNWHEWPFEMNNTFAMFGIRTDSLRLLPSLERWTGAHNIQAEQAHLYVLLADQTLQGPTQSGQVNCYLLGEQWHKLKLLYYLPCKCTHFICMQTCTPNTYALHDLMLQYSQSITIWRVSICHALTCLSERAKK